MAGTSTLQPAKKNSRSKSNQASTAEVIQPIVEVADSEIQHLSDKAIKDYKIVRRAVDHGDQKAYAELMSRYKDSIYYMLLKMVNNRDDAEDLTIEAFGKAFRNIKQYTPDYAFSTWLFKIATNTVLILFVKKEN